MDAPAQPILYLDTTFLMHTLLDLILLYLTGKLCLLRPKKIHLLVAAGWGGVYGTLCMMNFHPWLLHPIVRLSFPCVLIYIALHPTTIKDWVNSIIVFCLFNILTTGTIFLLFFSQAPTKNFQHIFIWVIGIGVLFGVTYQLLRAIPQLSHKLTEVHVEICLEQKKICCQGFVDTGNSLIDPADHKPVIVLRNHLFQSIMGLEDQDFQQNGLDHWLTQNEQLRTRLRVIPYSSVGKTHGMMIGFRSDTVVVKNDLTTAKHQGIVIALTEEKIPDCLIPAALL